MKIFYKNPSQFAANDKESEETLWQSKKKMEEAITSMDVDFAKWYTDVVRKADPGRSFQRQGVHHHPALRLYNLGKYPGYFGWHV